MKKYLFSVLVVILVLFNISSINPVSANQVFTDVPTTHSNYQDILYLLNKAVISSDQKVYGVQNIVTREEVAVMVAKAKKLNGTPRATKFRDVPKSNPNSGYIQSAVEAGIINGYDDGTFKPTTKVTRGHMAAFIARAFSLPNGTKTFKDVGPNSTAYKAVSQLAAAGITTGYEDGTFKPQNNLTRGHISAFLARALRYEEAPGVTTNPFPDPATVKTPTGWTADKLKEYEAKVIDTVYRYSPIVGSGMSFGTSHYSVTQFDDPLHLSRIENDLKIVKSSATIQEWVNAANEVIRTGGLYIAPDYSYALYASYGTVRGKRYVLLHYAR